MILFNLARAFFFLTFVRGFLLYFHFTTIETMTIQFIMLSHFLRFQNVNLTQFNNENEMKFFYNFQILICFRLVASCWYNEFFGR